MLAGTTLTWPEWKSLKLRRNSDWEAAIRRLPAPLRQRLADGVRLPRPVPTPRALRFLALNLGEIYPRANIDRSIGERSAVRAMTRHRSRPMAMARSEGPFVHVQVEP